MYDLQSVLQRPTQNCILNFESDILLHGNPHQVRTCSVVCNFVLLIEINLMLRCDLTCVDRMQLRLVIGSIVTLKVNRGSDILSAVEPTKYEATLLEALPLAF